MNIMLLWGVVLFNFFILFFMMGFYFFVYDECWIFEFKLGSFVSVGVDYVVVVDWMSVLFMSLVLLISFCVFLYSVEYMGSDVNIVRFCFLVLLFVLSMGLVIFSSNLMGILIGWDGLGITSYVLVIYYNNVRSLNAGMITFLSNRLGDIGLLMSIVWMFGFGNWNYFVYVNVMNDTNLGLVGLFIMMGCMTKSAQIPFSAWLPAAMAAPTPVSALVHSSTLVTAGVYLLVRFSVYYSFDFFSWFLLGVGILTMMMSGYCSLWEMDMSSVVALSTLSQLGFMMMILGFGSWLLAYFHLLTHALFKSLLFLCVGYIIHGYSGEQDFRSVGGLINSPVVMSGMNISLLALMGFPFLTSFYSKDVIIEMMLGGGNGLLVVFFLMVGLGLTVLYSFRLGYFSIWGFCLYNSGVDVSSGFMMEFSIVVLVLFSVFYGFFLSWWLFNIPSVIIVSVYVKLIGLIFICFGLFMCVVVIINDLWWDFGEMLFGLLGGSMWFMVGLSGNSMCRVVDECYGVFEGGWMEVIGGWGLMSVLKFMTVVLESFWSNIFMVYLFSFLLWVVVVLVIF
uniref:NADH-ubiquinone oxidoreductase chain 5 n=1 Tax=Pseudocellus pearsei TaxID=58148 RepID=A9LI79_9ARAC|nr:NADH dehydrogenase subunit 5 [Pseudocellus pearsei]ABS71910.1 NADH dehydrogenase subunit 5 [Pseudocellus pearsei]